MGPAPGPRKALSRERRETASPEPMRRMLAALDRDPDELGPGDPLPPLWHWLYFLPDEPTSRLGPDGHPARSGFRPPVVPPRRMFAGCRVEFLRPLPIGGSLQRLEYVLEVEEKEGRSGRMVFVTVVAQIRAQGREALRERTTHVYLDRVGIERPPPEEEAFSAAFTREMAPGPALLFRFAALTFNAHRIHYDLPYAREEGYPGLVVQGPLMAIMLAQLASEQSPDGLARFEHRQLAPAWAGQKLSLIGRPGPDNNLELQARKSGGRVAALARAWPR